MVGGGSRVPGGRAGSASPCCGLVVVTPAGLLLSRRQRHGADGDQDQHHLGAAGPELGRSVFLAALSPGSSSSSSNPSHCYLPPSLPQSWPANCTSAWTTSTGSAWRTPTRCWTRAPPCSACGRAGRARGPRVSLRPLRWLLAAPTSPT